MLDRLNLFRKRVPFWWWLAYDWLIAVAITALFVLAHDWEGRVLPVVLSCALGFSLFLDTIEAYVKREIGPGHDERREPGVPCGCFLICGDLAFEYDDPRSVCRGLPRGLSS